MTAITRITVSDEARPTKEQFHIERSKCIDAFASVEQTIIALLAKLNIPANGGPFGQKLDDIKKAKASPQFSKTQLDNLRILLPACEQLNNLRNDIVHARLHIVVIEGEAKACFTNTRECLSGIQAARLFTLPGLAKFHQELAKLQVELNQVLINPASLPQPPSPGAAGGP